MAYVVDGSYLFSYHLLHSSQDPLVKTILGGIGAGLLGVNIAYLYHRRKVRKEDTPSYNSVRKYLRERLEDLDLPEKQIKEIMNENEMNEKNKNDKSKGFLNSVLSIKSIKDRLGSIKI